MDDVRTVLAAVGSERTAFFGCHLGGRLALLFAATHPEQTTAVVTFAVAPGHPARRRLPLGFDPRGAGAAPRRHPGRALDPEQLLARPRPDAMRPTPPRAAGGATYLHSAASAARERSTRSRRSARWTSAGCSARCRRPRWCCTGPATGSPTSRRAATWPSGSPAPFRELPGDDHLPFFGDQDTVVALTQEFLTGAMPDGRARPGVLTVLFTDIVDSTARATELGDRRWRRLLEEHDNVVRVALARFRGREVETTGDGFLATFDGPARAIRAAAAIRAELAEHGLRSGSGCTPARSSWSATTSAGSRCTSPPG